MSGTFKPVMRAANKAVFQPKKVASGERVLRDVPKKAHKAKPAVGKGNYVKAPLFRDKATSPRWQANALVNNPGNVAAGSAIGGGSGAIGYEHRKEVRKDRKTAVDISGGAAIGGGMGHFVRQQAAYGAKNTAQRQFKPYTKRGNYGPYTDTPHAPALKKLSRDAQKAAKGSVRAKAEYFDEHFPKDVPSYRARKILNASDKKPVVAGAVAAGAALGAAAGLRHSKVNKSLDPFGVEKMISKGYTPIKQRRQQRLHANISTASGIGAVATAGALGAGLLAPKLAGKGLLKKVPVKAAEEFGSKVKHGTTYTGIGLGGLGGANTLYGSHLTRKENPVPVKKDAGLVDEGFSKNWSPVAPIKSPEQKRAGRADVYHHGGEALGGAAMSIGGGVAAAGKYQGSQRNLDRVGQKASAAKLTAYKPQALHLNNVKAQGEKAAGVARAAEGVKAATKIRRGGLAGALGAGTIVGAEIAGHHKNRGWKPYTD